MLLTNKLYKEVSLDEYKAAKKVAINHLTYNYSSKTDKEKWDFLLPKLAALVPNQINSTLWGVRFKDELANFQRKRKEGNANFFNLSLHDSLDYFENFYFLYTIEDKKFKLNTAQKNKLLEAIFDAMGTCETGINTRFDMVLKLYRTDLDWVTNCLSKQRYELVSGLHDRFNYERNVHGLFHVHVLNIMNQEAKKSGFGLTIDHSLRDVWEHKIQTPSGVFIPKSDVQTYFKQHAPGIFKQDYDDQILETLSQHLLFEINELYQPVNGVPWDIAGRTLEGEDITAFNKFIQDRLGFDGAGGELGDPNDDYTQFTLKPRADFFALLRGFVQEKLIREGHHIPMDGISDASDADLKNVRFKNGITVAALKDVNQAIVGCDAETKRACRATLIKHADVVLQYPDLLLLHVKTNPELLSILPKVLTRDAYFLEQAVSTVDALLADAISGRDNREIRYLRALLLRLARHDKSYLNQCTTTMGREYFEQYTDAKANNKIQALAGLKQNEVLGFSKTARLAQGLTPDELIEIIRYRKQHNLPPLPYCNDASGLELFKQELGTQRINQWDTQGLAALRGQASECVRLGIDKPVLGGDSALKHLAKNDLWFMAMARHQQANTGSFKNLRQAWNLLMQCCKRLLAVLWELTKIMLTLVMGLSLVVLAVLTIDLLPPFLFLSIWLFSLAALALSQVLENRDLALAAFVVGLIGFCLLAFNAVILAVILQVTIALIVYQVIFNLVPVAEEFYDTVALFCTRAFAIFYDDESGYTPNTTDDELMACDKIIADIAVDGYDVSLEKVDALMNMQKTIAMDNEPGDHLNKPYRFFYHDEERNVSFNDVVAMAPEDERLFAMG